MEPQFHSYITTEQTLLDTTGFSLWILNFAARSRGTKHSWTPQASACGASTSQLHHEGPNTPGHHRLQPVEPQPHSYITTDSTPLDTTGFSLWCLNFTATSRRTKHSWTPQAEACGASISQLHHDGPNTQGHHRLQPVEPQLHSYITTEQTLLDTTGFSLWSLNTTARSRRTKHSWTPQASACGASTSQLHHDGANTPGHHRLKRLWAKTSPMGNILICTNKDPIMIL